MITTHFMIFFFNTKYDKSNKSPRKKLPFFEPILKKKKIKMVAIRDSKSCAKECGGSNHFKKFACNFLTLANNSYYLLVNSNDINKDWARGYGRVKIIFFFCVQLQRKLFLPSGNTMYGVWHLPGVGRSKGEVSLNIRLSFFV